MPMVSHLAAGCYRAHSWFIAVSSRWWFVFPLVTEGDGDEGAVRDMAARE